VFVLIYHLVKYSACLYESLFWDYAFNITGRIYFL